MRTYDLLRKSVRPAGSGRRALMFLGKPRNARQGFPPALKILGIRLCGPAGIETRFREQRGQQRQAPLLEMRGLSKTAGCERAFHEAKRPGTMAGHGRQHRGRQSSGGPQQKSSHLLHPWCWTATPTTQNY